MTMETAPDQVETQLEIHCEAAAKLNFACHQNAYAVLRDLRIENLSEDEAARALTVTLQSDPAFLQPKSWTIDRIDALGAASIESRDLDLDAQLLSTLTESIRGTLQVRVEQGGEVVCEHQQAIELLAPNEWGGAGYMPELLAAFCLPNDPAIDRIIHDASGLLRQAGKDDSIDGYKSGKRQRVWEIAGAIYAAVANLGLSYSTPPASFESDGQKVRLPGQILQGRVATCLDSALLLAAAFEQAGLNPILALLDGHVLVGVWLQPEKLASIVNDEAEVLRKRAQLNELVLLESTLLTSHPAPPFSRAIENATAQLAPGNDDHFVTAVDIARARAHRISPLALPREDGDFESEQTAEATTELSLEAAPALPDFDQEFVAEKPTTPDGRVERWQRKLLDLSARNPLLNHRSTKSSVPLVCPDPGLLEDKLASGVKIALAPAPVANTQTQDREIYRERTGSDIDEAYARDALEQRQAIVSLPKAELDKRAVEIYRKARTSLQEGGANTLYLALGFLLWKRDENDTRRFRAPLILLPVSLQRKSVRSGVKMVAHDDEPRFNTTLLEMLRKDFGINIQGLDEGLPEDDSGIDVTGVWDRVRRAIVDSTGFEVVEDVVLGHFSFAKYLMWKDLVDRTDALRKNPVVEHLIQTPRDPYPSEVDFVERQDIDQQFSPSDFFAPLPADSAQMAAVASASRGKDFIVIGPPGTGKSQTISNLIAHLLGSGKTVLFVSEKTAALDVVYRRLEDVGLGRFCLELHSNKARKADVLAQLQAAWEANSQRTSREWEDEAQRLKTLRDRLNLVVHHLHRVHDNGLTAHFAMGMKIKHPGLAARLQFAWPAAGQHTREQLDEMRQAASLLQVQARAVKQVSGSPFASITHGDWSPSWENAMVAAANDLGKAAFDLEQTATAVAAALQVNFPDLDLAKLAAVSELAQALLLAHGKQVEFACTGEGQSTIDALAKASIEIHDYQAAQNKLSCSYEAMAWRKLDGDRLKARWEEANQTWFLKSFFAKRAIRKEMQTGGAQGTPDPSKDASILAELRKHGEAIDGLNSDLEDLRAWKSHDSDVKQLEELRAVAVKLRGALNELVSTPQEMLALREKLRELVDGGNDLLASNAPIGQTLQEYVSRLQHFDQSSLAYEQQAGRSIADSFGEQAPVLQSVCESTRAIATRHAELNQWCAWQRRRSEAAQLDLGPLIEAVEDGSVAVEEVPETFDAAYCAWWSERLLDEDEVLRSFSSAEHLDTIEQFRELDESFLTTTARYVAAQLSSQLPGQSDVPQSSQWGLLKREMTKRARHKPVRQLMQEAPEALTRLAPCLMMSPLSVAQYLPPDQSLFDVVIFDEASQITVWDAVGTIARGKQVVVAGDPKQMPPTNFFARADDDADGDVDYEGDLESILDELRSSNVPEHTLNLHYRSRRESLIAFSNRHYYDNKLVTFPAPVHPDMGVRLVQVDGHYDRGKTRTNHGEAEAIVAEVVRRLTSEESAERDLTIGVVTFNSEQQTLIQDLLDEARAKNPELEWAFAEDCLEPVFVKNLETVQGDERDVILFSVTYGPDESGKMYMNFGPLNREGGERRLNVAMTRARHEMVVFATLHPDRIDLSRTSARAVADLKHFLEYAERGPAVLGASLHGSLGDFESPFESAVAEALRDRGWQVHPQVGVSAFRVDLGIVHPDHPETYVVGVECDGAMYHSSSYARERDKIRQAVLGGLGWKLLKAWATEWWINQEAALDALDQAIREQLDLDRARRTGQLTEAQPPAEDHAEIAEPDAETNDETVESTEGDDANREGAQRGVPYRLAELTIDTKGHQLGDLAPSDLIEPVAYIAEIEAPIHIDDVVRRVTLAADLTRAGSKIRKLIDSAIHEAEQQQQVERVDDFLWRPGQEEATVRNRSELPSQDKKFDRVAPDEISRALLDVIERNFSLSEDDAYSEAAKDLGFHRVTASIAESFGKELAILAEEGEVERDGATLIRKHH